MYTYEVATLDGPPDPAPIHSGCEQLLTCHETTARFEKVEDLGAHRTSLPRVGQPDQDRSGICGGTSL